MSIKFECSINEDVIEKFNLALKLNKDDVEEVIEQYMMDYISSSFSKASQVYKIQSRKYNKIDNSTNNDTGKARNRIPKWAVKPEQINHKIVRAFFQVEKENGYVTMKTLERRCSDEVTYPTTYVKNFNTNFSQMKFDGPKSHGKIFEVNDDNVKIWEYGRETLLDYKEFFCR